MNRRNLLTLFFAGAVATAMAVPAKRGQWSSITLSDGTSIRVELRGDENGHFWLSEDNRCFLQKAANVFEEVSLPEVQARQQRRAAARQQARSRRLSAPRREFGEPSSFTGSKKGLVILVEFADVGFRETSNLATFHDILNAEGYRKGSFKGSVHDYFYDQSGGQFDLSFDVVGPVRLSHDEEYYGANIGEDDLRDGEFASEAIQLAADLADFTLYDWQGDGEVDQVFLLYAGKGEADGGAASTIWPHEWTLTEATEYEPDIHPLTIDGMTVDTYACGPELNGSSRLNGIGTICHEFTHCLGLPDFYDTVGSNFGMYKWSLMDYGSYNDDGYTPCNYTSYERWFCGWQTPIALKNGDSIEDMASLSDYGNTYIIYNENEPNEFFLFENHQRKGWDSDAQSEGLLVLHVDYDKAAWQANAVNTDSRRQRCTILPADNNRSRYSLGGDCYPYEGNDIIKDDTSPAFILYNKNAQGTYALGYTISEITQNGDGSMRFKVKQKATDPVDSIDGVLDLTDDARSGSSAKVFRLDGRYVGNTTSALPPGIYVVNGRKVVKK